MKGNGLQKKLCKWREIELNKKRTKDGEGTESKQKPFAKESKNRNLSGMEGEGKRFSHGELIIRHCTNKDTEKNRKNKKQQ